MIVNLWAEGGTIIFPEIPLDETKSYSMTLLKAGVQFLKPRQLPQLLCIRSDLIITNSGNQWSVIDFGILPGGSDYLEFKPTHPTVYKLKYTSFQGHFINFDFVEPEIFTSFFNRSYIQVKIEENGKCFPLAR
jgi:hypothetical protein